LFFAIFLNLQSIFLVDAGFGMIAAFFRVCSETVGPLHFLKNR
jgi:hypothetical protein